MKLKILCYAVGILCSATLSAEDVKPDLSVQAISATENNQEEIRQLSKAFGHFIGRNLKNPGFSFDLHMVIEGIRDGAQGAPAPMSDKEYEQLLQVYQAKAFMALSENNLREASDFLAGNKLKNTVIEIEPSKLQYEIVKEGAGEIVSKGNSPMLHYTGTFINGETFGSTKDLDNPVTLSLDQTIPGFKQGIIGMKEGEVRRLFIHPDLGYGVNGPFPPNSLLIFEIELIKANSQEASQTESQENRKQS